MVALIIVNANLLIRAITVLARMIPRSRYSTFRFVAISDDTAIAFVLCFRAFHPRLFPFESAAPEPTT